MSTMPWFLFYINSPLVKLEILVNRMEILALSLLISGLCRIQTIFTYISIFITNTYLGWCLLYMANLLLDSDFPPPLVLLYHTAPRPTSWVLVSPSNSLHYTPALSQGHLCLPTPPHFCSCSLSVHELEHPTGGTGEGQLKATLQVLGCREERLKSTERKRPRSASIDSFFPVIA